MKNKYLSWNARRPAHNCLLFVALSAQIGAYKGDDAI